MFKDEFTAWFIAGMIGSVMKDLYGLFAVLSRFATFHIIHIAADIFLKKPHIQIFLGYLIGMIIDLSVGGIFGILSGLTLRCFGNRHYLLKGFVIGFTIWLGIFGIIMHTLPQIFELQVNRPNEVLNFLLVHVVYGMVTSYCIIKFTWPAPLR
ncbi:hypothetical protein EDC14_101966 [Hydrogenispora ethanolica]|uniref:Uncharacterized protein n=1 Tax=Hydrogenispora ethanolica TaxID=1082276 RepID=A0A4R1RF41_HYDET|nr:hypothetical protein [Hydrogenispora ethanolica]TCL64260.1 hypothetical protein EDC14_101966 [Hydrogenispora ethanolica]